MPPILRRHAPILLLLVLQQLLLWAQVLTHHPVVTVTWDCVAGTMGREVLRGFTFSPLDTYDGILGGILVSGLLGAPIYALFGVTGFSIKLVATAFSAAILLAGYWMLLRTQGRTAALLGAALLAVPVPIAWLSQLIPGHWHATQQLFDLLVAGLCALVVFGDPARRTGRMFLAGLTTGVAIFNCFGALLLLPASWLLLWATVRGPRGLRLGGLYVAGVVLGSLAIPWKLFLHEPFGLSRAGKAGVPHEATAVYARLDKLWQLVDGDLSWGLHFQEALHRSHGTMATLRLADLVVNGLLVGLALATIRVLPSLGRVLWGALPGTGGAAVARLSPLVLPVLMSLCYLCAFLLSEMDLTRLPWFLSNQREMGHLLLIPWVMAMGLCLAGTLASLWTERLTGRTPDGELRLLRGAFPVAALCFAAVLGGNLVALVGAPLLAQPDDAPLHIARGSCRDVAGFYMGPSLRGDWDLGGELCARYPQGEVEECLRGVAWAFGFAEVDFESGGPGEGRAESCAPLPSRFARECLRGLGWALQSNGEGGMVVRSEEIGRCEQQGSPENIDACWAGVGFPLGDHLHNAPDKLMRVLENIPDERRLSVARGAGTHLGRTYGSLRWMETLCSRWDADVQGACREGVAESLSFRADEAAVRAR